jgi:hypothetical protein
MRIHRIGLALTSVSTMKSSISTMHATATATVALP